MYAVVLNDGETWTDLEGCRVIYVPDAERDDPEDIDELVKEAYGHGVPVSVGFGSEQLQDVYDASSTSD